MMSHANSKGVGATWFAVLLGSSLVCCRAQTTEADLSARLVGKPLLLRGTWAADKLVFDAGGTPTSTYHTAPFSICGIDVTSVQVSGSLVHIGGRRVALQFSRTGDVSRVPMLEGKSGKQHPEAIRIEIQAGGTNDFSAALDAIFANDLAAMVPQMPDFWQIYAKKHFLSAADAEGSASQDGSAPIPTPVSVRPKHVGGDVRPPSVIGMVDAKYSDAARTMKISTKAVMSLWVGPDGVPSHITVRQPAGFGLDEEAARAVSQYTFKPATMNGLPVTVDLNIEVDFHIF